MDALQCLKTRRSVRKFRQGEIDRDILLDILDCGRLAASGVNQQPWHFVVVQNPVLRSRIADITNHGKFIAEASACILVFCEQTKYYLEDGSAATQNILNAARAHALGSCWVAGDKKDYCAAIGSLTGAPEHLKLVSLIAIGIPVEQPSPPHKKPLGEVVHWEQF